MRQFGKPWEAGCEELERTSAPEVILSNTATLPEMHRSEWRFY